MPGQFQQLYVIPESFHRYSDNLVAFENEIKNYASPLEKLQY